MSYTVRFKRGWFAPTEAVVTARHRDGRPFLQASGRRFKKGFTYELSDVMFNELIKAMPDQDHEGRYVFFEVVDADGAILAREPAKPSETLRDFDVERAEGEEIEKKEVEAAANEEDEKKRRRAESLAKARAAKKAKRLADAKAAALGR